MKESSQNVKKDLPILQSKDLFNIDEIVTIRTGFR